MRLGQVGSILLLIGCYCALPILGMEMAVMFMVVNAPNSAEIVPLALSLNSWSLFTTLLLGTLTGLFAGSLVTVIALIRARVIPLWSLAFILLPVASAFLPLPEIVGNLLGSLGVMAPLFWATARILRDRGPTPSLEPKGAAA